MPANTPPTSAKREEGIALNIAQVLYTGVVAIIAAQEYILRDLLHMSPPILQHQDVPHCDAEEALPSLAEAGSSNTSVLLEWSTEEKRVELKSLLSNMMRVKKELHHKKEDAESRDLVTAADIHCQKIITYFLKRLFPVLPFTIVGEEDEDEDFAIQMQEEHLQACWDIYKPLNERKFPGADALRAVAMAAPDLVLVRADSLQSMRERVMIFIDPIDGTNAFVDADLEVPLTLFGIAVDGIPCAAVTNRVFFSELPPVDPCILQQLRTANQPGGEKTASSTLLEPLPYDRPYQSLSYILNPEPICLRSDVTEKEGKFLVPMPATAPKRGAALPKPDALAPYCFLVHQGMPLPLSLKEHFFTCLRPEVQFPTSEPSLGATDVVSLTYSGTTKENYLEKIAAPFVPYKAEKARGAGNKFMQLIRSALVQSAHLAAAVPAVETHENLEQFFGSAFCAFGEYCDVFVSPPTSIFKWDTCASHAFLFASGGDIMDLQGNQVRYYPQSYYERAMKCHAKDLCPASAVAGLDTGIVGFTARFRAEAVQRLAGSMNSQATESAAAA